MKKTLLVALLGLMTAITALAASTEPVSMTITLKNGNIVTYNASNMDSVRFVGGQFGESGAIGMKIYLKGINTSIDYLYSQITNVTYIEPSNAITFKRITDPGQLEVGKRYIIVYENGLIALPNNVNSNSAVKLGQTIQIKNNTVVLEGDDHGVGIFIMGEGYTLMYSNPSSNGTYYLTLTNDNSGLRATNTSQNWTISFSGDNAQIIANDGTDNRWIREYDATDGADFRTYKTSTTNGNPIQLYKEDDGSSMASVSAPTFFPNGGVITGPTQVIINCATENASIYYTIDGSIPTSSSTLYSEAITISATTTFKALAVKDGIISDVTTVSFTLVDPSNNVNANWNIEGSGIPLSKGDPTFTNQSTDDYAWRLEYPHINTASSNQRVVKSVSTYGINYSVEWDNDKIANRWTCYTMCSKNNATNTTRHDDFKSDPAVTVSASSSYTESSTYSRGHLCPSADRLASIEQNKQTFFMTNMQPQYSNHNSGLWSTLEGYVRTKWQPTNNTDTLYVVKAATIENVTLNNTSSSGIITTTTDGAGHTLVVPKYFYMAFLYYEKSTGDYKAFALWTEHLENKNPKAATVITNRISIDELERRTGIDFFCNLPDDIEAIVEATATYWDFSSN
ncbi:MAG: DNA/RNA non-specific endonuclease [Muribaculaceae bacterium]|nr:DNA/RNA non-specific endonuclease [Muribaculaceae bacterium]